ncbi:MAG: hypothetical protein P4L56_21175, partial [Candidatus Sulfopaludibacter sp.]|nr:hypothetical protein [Candidatus Sulfopaludibacter sp.]
AKTSGTALQKLFDGTKVLKPGDVAPLAPARPRVAAPVVAVSQPAPLPRKEPAFVMEIISGTKKDHVNFDGNNQGGK